LAVASVGAVAALAPLKTVEPFVIRVDSATGIVDTVSALKSTPARYQIFSWALRARAGRLQLSRSRNQLSHDFPAFGAGRTGSFRSLVPWFQSRKPAGRSRPFGIATVDQSDFAPSRQCRVGAFHEREPHGEETRITHCVSTLTFSYANAPMSSTDRLINPLGFLVSEYRVDPEVLP
jgi:type IV secretion system protein VirB8